MATSGEVKTFWQEHGNEEVVSLLTLFDGFGEAFIRWKAVEFPTQDPASAYIALFEVLEWAAALDERLSPGWSHKNRTLTPSGRWVWSKELRGLRWARHRVRHDWAIALTPIRSTDLPWGPYEGQFEYEWVWRESLPEERRARFREDEPYYRSHLAGKPARVTMNLVRRFFLFMHTVHHPEIAQDDIDGLLTLKGWSK